MAMLYKDISELLINEENTILQVMDLLNRSKNKILFIHCNHILLASVTDGDIRRWILKGGNIDAPIKLAANYSPVYLDENKSYLADQVMKETSIDAIPLVNKKKEIKRILFLNEQYEMIETFDDNISVVIMAGGVGSRLSPYTKILPKPLIPIGELPISEHIINQFKKYGCNDFIMVINYKRNMIKAYFNEIEKDYKVNYIIEEKALGTGGGLSLLKDAITNTFILTNCDVLINYNLNSIYKHHKKSGNIITMICPLKKFTIPYGVVTVSHSGDIESIQEKPSMAFYVNTGCYFVEPEVVRMLDYNEPIDFPDVIKKCIEGGKKVGAYPIDENAWLDMGQFDELAKMKESLNY